MQYEAKTVREYIDLLPEDRRPVIDRLRQIISANLPDGFEEQIAYGMISFSVPLSRYPAGYHAKKGEPLPFISLASQKNHVALYHMAFTRKFLREFHRKVPRTVPHKVPRKVPHKVPS